MHNNTDKKHKDLLARVDEFLNKSRRYSKAANPSNKKSRSQTPNKNPKTEFSSKNKTNFPNRKNEKKSENYENLQFYEENGESPEAPKSSIFPLKNIENLELDIESPSRIENLSNEQNSEIGLSGLDTKEIEKFNDEYNFLSEKFNELKNQRIELSRFQRGEIENLERYRNELKNRIKIKSKGIDELGSDVVKMEVELSKVKKNQIIKKNFFF